MNELLGPLQMRIMPILWAVDSGTVHDVHDALNTQVGFPKLAYTTVLTVIRNLCARGFLDRVEGTARGYTWRARVSRAEYMKSATGFFLQSHYAGNKAALVKQLELA